MPEDRRPTKFNRNPMLWLAVAFGVGIIVESVLNVDLVAATAAATVLIAVSLVFRAHTRATWLMLAAAVCAGLVAALAEKQSVSPDRVKIIYDSGKISSGEPVEVEGVLQGRPEASIDGVLLTVATERIRHRGIDLPASGNVRLFLKTSDPTDLKYGTRILVTTKLERDDGYLNPGGMPRREILDRQRIDATGAIKSPLLVEKLADESVLLPLAWVYDRRATMIDSLRNNLSPSAAGVMIASLLGNREFLDKETADLFRDGGTFHILVISGLHITFFGAFLVGILRIITRRYWFIFVFTNIVLWLYTLAVGADVPVVRAALMFTVMSFAYILRRRGGLLNSLGISVLILLSWRPSDVFNPSFQLTFVSVAAIVAIAFPLLEMLKRIGRWTPTPDEPFPPAAPRWLVGLAETIYWNEKAWEIDAKRHIWKAIIAKSPLLPAIATSGIQYFTRPVFEGILVSLVVMICMLPLSIIYFHRVAIGSIVLNLWVGFFIALESFAAVTAVMIASFLNESVARGFFALAEVFNWLMLLLPKLISVDGWASFRLPAYTGNGRLVYGLFIPLLVFLAIAINSWRPFEVGRRRSAVGRRLVAAGATALGVLILISILSPFSGHRPDGRLRVDFLDVGQGDSALITFPDGRTMLVDGGGNRRYGDDTENPDLTPDFQGIGETVVSPFLWDRGLSRIDFLLATHGDADHTQGLIDVARNFQIGTAILGREPLESDELKELKNILDRRGVPTEYVAAGVSFKFGEVMAEVLNPVSDRSDAKSSNDSSVVLRLTFLNRSFLLTGDIESAAERELAATASIQTDVIKVAHHGSRTSSTQAFVDRSGARIAVIPVGRTSQHGHPHTEVVERWKAAGAEVVTTGSSGTVTVSTDGSDIKLSRFQD